MKKPKALFFWSGGKDSALCLYKVLKEAKYEVVSLVTTVSADLKRVAMHGTMEELIAEQAKRIRRSDGGTGLPLDIMYVNSYPVNEEYEKSLAEVLTKFAEKGIDKVIFGDIFLESVRNYREGLLAPFGFEAVYPLWDLPTGHLISEFLESGFRAVVCCCDNSLFGDRILGRTLDAELVGSFPPEVDPCGEHGEFHTFTYDGPLFISPVPIETADRVLKVYEVDPERGEEKGFWFIDLHLRR